jgi:hypothetical protein
MTSHENLFAQIETLLDGIDRDECHPDGGWWQTSDGSTFGRIKLRELKELISASLPAAQPELDTSQLSDGYHTFAELYEHRHALCLALMRAMPQHCWFSWRHADGEQCFGGDDWFIVGAELPRGESVTYHLPAELYPVAQATGATELAKGRLWDGHTASDVVVRLREWAALSQPEPEVVGVTDEEVPYSDPPQWCNTPDMGLAWKAGRTLGWQMSQRRYAPPHHRADARRAGGDGCRLCVHGQKSTQRGRQHYCRRADRCSGSNDEPNR